jgi:hypothetical protein
MSEKPDCEVMAAKHIFWKRKMNKAFENFVSMVKIRWNKYVKKDHSVDISVLSEDIR